MKLVPQGVTRSAARAILQAKKNSPHIFFGLGVAGILGSTFLACKSTLKLSETIDEIEKDVIDVKSKHNENTEDRQRYHDLAPVYLRGVVKVGKLYGPSIILGGASVAALTGSHVQMTRRNSALTATLALVSKAYDDYRLRVQEELGEEREAELYYCMEDVTLAKDGDASKEVGTVIDPTKHSIHARWFDAASCHWQNNREFNQYFVKVQNQYAQDKLNANGHFFLNEAYDLFDIPRTPAGAIMGWVRNSKTGHGYIDFGLYEADNARFLDGSEKDILLDFNIDPEPIYKQI